MFVIYDIYDGEMGKSASETFLFGAGNLVRSDFEHLNLF